MTYLNERWNPLRRYLILLVTLLMTLQGCSLLQAVRQRTAIQNATYNLKAIRLANADLSGVNFAIDIAVTNPNDIQIIFDRMKYDLIINDKPIASGSTDVQQAIPAGFTKTLTFNLGAKYADVGLSLLNAIQTQKATYRLDGNAFFDTPLGPIQYPFTVLKSGN